MKKYIFSFLITALVIAGGVTAIAAFWNTGGLGSPTIAYSNVTSTTATFTGAYTFNSSYINYSFKLIGPLVPNGPIVTTTLGSNFSLYSYTPDPVYKITNPNYINGPANYSSTASYNATGLVPDTNYVVYACGYYNTQGAIDDATCGNPIEFKTKVSGINNPAGNGNTASGIAPMLSSGTTPILNWTKVAGATAYNVRVASDPSFSNMVITGKDLAGNTLPVPEGALQSGATYYWDANACNANGCSAWSSPAWIFRTAVSAVPAPVAGGKASSSSGPASYGLADCTTLANGDMYCCCPGVVFSGQSILTQINQ